MDTRAATTGFTSTLEYGINLSVKSNSLIEAWRDTPPLMCALHNEVSDLVVVLDDTHAAAKTAAHDASAKSAELLDDLERPLVEVFRVLQAVDGLVGELLAARDGRHRGRILSRNVRAAGFQGRLRDARVALYNCLLAHNVYGYLARSGPTKANDLAAKWPPWHSWI